MCMETCVDAQDMRHIDYSCVKQLFDASKLSSVAESVSRFAVSDKSVKDKHMDYFVGSIHAAS